MVRAQRPRKPYYGFEVEIIRIIVPLLMVKQVGKVVDAGHRIGMLLSQLALPSFQRSQDHLLGRLILSLIQ